MRLVQPMTATAIALFVVATMPVYAAGKYDGTWIIDLPPSAITGGNPDPTCPALRFPIRIKDNSINASLERVPSVNPNVIGPGYSGNAIPVKGSVDSSGMLTASWQRYTATGTLQAGIVTVKGPCGPRQGTATLVPGP